MRSTDKEYELLTLIAQRLDLRRVTVEHPAWLEQVSGDSDFLSPSADCFYVRSKWADGPALVSGPCRVELDTHLKLGELCVKNGLEVCFGWSMEHDPEGTQRIIVYRPSERLLELLRLGAASGMTSPRH